MRIAMFGLAIGLAACETTGGDVHVAYKLGASPEMRQADFDSCKIASFKEIPQTMATDVRPGFSSPGTIQCSTIGRTTDCSTIGGFSSPPVVTSRDANLGLRNRYIERCMGTKGYEILVRPICTPEQAKTLQSGAPPKCASQKLDT